ncbi:MAG TPA: ATP-binding protein [Actinomycetota bacterium]|nr:ATP-binding protein [Actinomycetota bacterium]
MVPRKLAGEVLTGYLVLAVAGVAVAAALNGHGASALLASALALLVLAVVLAAMLARALAGPLGGLARATSRLVATISPERAGALEAVDPDELATELTVLASRLRDRLDELTEERDRAGQILDALEDGVLLLDGAGRLLVANPVARSWFALPDHYRPGLPARRVLGVPLVAELAEEAATKQAPVTGTVTVVFPEHRTLSARAFPLADRGPTGRIVVTLTDITQRRRVEVLRRDFVVNASHELKTPVAAVRALSETLQSALSDDPAAARRFATRIAREAERLDLLVRDLLDLSKVERGTLACEPVDLTSLAKEVVGSYADRAEERRIQLRAALEPGASMRGDRAQLGLLLSNLVDNALHYTSPRGTVRVRLDTCESRVVLQVADTGRGIPASELPRIFERFYRVDKARDRQSGGTGLGLAIVRHVAESHGGTVQVDSELGRGSTFTVALPVGGPPAPLGPQRSAAAP